MTKTLTLCFVILISSQMGRTQSELDVYIDTIDFETTYPDMVVDTAATNLWQIGRPQKTIFNAAYSGDNVIITDTSAFYPTNNHSYFDIVVTDENFLGFYGGDVFFKFKHMIDSDTLHDGGYITVSYDNGTTWTNIIEDYNSGYDIIPGAQFVIPQTIYSFSDTLYNGEYGFSGSRTNWSEVIFGWGITPVKKLLPDTTLVRFNFISDSLDHQREGWMIDDIILWAPYLGSYVNEVNKLTFSIYPNPVSTHFQINTSNAGKLEMNIYNEQGSLVRKKAYPNGNIIVVPRGDLKAGNYLVELINENGLRATNRIVVMPE